MNTIEVNQISDLWFRTFLETVDPAQTANEIAFLERQLPRPPYQCVLDLCCGQGRHALPLAQRGYQVTGIDREPTVIAHARAAAVSSPATFIEIDVRRLGELNETWDAAIIMWASFGYLSTAENLALLAEIRRHLLPRGRVILDLYNQDFFTERQGERQVVRNGVEVTERKHIAGGRLHVELRYVAHDVIDRFSWQIFRPDDLLDTVRRVGFNPVLLCSEFDEGIAPSSEHGRMQIVMER